MPASVETDKVQTPSCPLNTRDSNVTNNADHPEGNDALCFTPGLPGASFAAGTIHAYLAADRKPPKVVAGISLGTLSAAVMQRSYRDLQDGKAARQQGNELEATRWKFFRKYLAMITDRPFDVLWKGIPDPADFLAELPPIKDPAPETIDRPELAKLREEWEKEERHSRRELYLLVKLGHWLARLPLRVSAVANTVVSYVRSKEKYSAPKIVRLAQYYMWLVSVIVSLILHVVRVPARFPNYKFSAWQEEAGLPRWLVRKAIWIIASSAGLTWFVGWRLAEGPTQQAWWEHILFLAVVICSVFVSGLIPALWQQLKKLKNRKRFVLIRKLAFLGAALFCSAGSVTLLFLLVWHFPLQQTPRHLYTAYVVSAAYVGLFAMLALNHGLAQRTGFHLCNLAGWVFQRPLFGYRVWGASVLALVVLFIFTADLSGIFLYWLVQSTGWVVALPFVGAVVALFFATSLGTYWIPMQGKFPFRGTPLACSVLAVSLITLRAHLSPNGQKQFWEPFQTLDSLQIFQRLLDVFCNFLDHHHFLEVPKTHAVPFSIAVVFVLALIIGAASYLYLSKRPQLIKHLLKKVAMEKHLVHDYHLKWALTQLFDEKMESPVLSHDPFHVLLVASPLQSLGTDPALNNQLWAKAAAKPKIVDVLRTTLAVPALLDPVSLGEQEIPIWYKPGRQKTNVDAVKKVDMVDASIVRHNPLPAFFNFIHRNHSELQAKKPPEQPLAEFLKSDDVSRARVHVVYSVPAQPSGVNGSRGKLDNIMDVAFLSLRLAQRRDINLEIDQTNFIARLAHETAKLLDQLPPSTKAALEEQAPKKLGEDQKQELDPLLPIFADHIAPATDLSFRNPLAPTRDEVLKHAAAGCKATLEQLYAPQIRQIVRYRAATYKRAPLTSYLGRTEVEYTASSTTGVECATLLTMLRRQKDPHFTGRTGLSEICQHCDKYLQANPDSGKKAAFSQEEVNGWRNRRNLDTEFPQLTSQEPRIVFVASGGVFRGPFHAGMVNAMLALNIKPDLIVGASVGTLVGAALAATLAAPNRKDARSVLDGLVETFQRSDEKIAFTKTLKNAARELGIRGKRIDLAPYELRKKILQGTKGDPGFAVTGTPPILIDAISDLLLLPHRETRRIAAQFVAGHFTDATRLLVAGVRKETLERLEVIDAVMDASLLEPSARRLLGSRLGFDMNARQPYRGRKIAIFGTATHLNQQQPVLLGRYRFDEPSYDFVNACLASSAFPAVFAPRRQDQIFPGIGCPDQIYSDGGMFDNLPISPALEILTASQRCWIKNSKGNAVKALGARVTSPDLFITGSLDISPSKDEKVFDNLVSIKNRAGVLQNNLKIQAFKEVSERISAHLEYLHKIAEAASTAGLKLPEDYLNGLVNATLLPVYPTNADHLNGTFQFCNSLGRKLDVVNKSMADGCFQTLSELAKAVAEPDKTVDGGPAKASARSRTVKGLAEKGRLPLLAATGGNFVRKEKSPTAGYYCPFFSRCEAGELVKFVCPFSEDPSASSFAVYQSCIGDKDHATPSANS